MENQLIPQNLDSPVFEAFAKSVDQQYIYICDVKTNLWRWSPYAVELFGLPGEYVQDLPEFWMTRVHPEDRERVGDTFAKLFSGAEREHSCEYRVMDARGNYIWVLCRGCMVLDKDGEQSLCAGILTDLGSRNRFDPTTGLPSFVQFQAVVNTLLEQPEPRGGVLLWGINQFRRINDTYQYAFGNELLKAYAKRISDLVPPGDTLFRMNGDQFAVICPNALPDDLSLLFQQVSDIGTKGVKVGGKKQRFTVSCGAVSYPGDGAQSDLLFTNLEYALETAKKDRQNELTFFAEEMRAQSLRIFHLNQRLHENVLNQFEGFSLCFQPLVSTDKHELLGAEVLLRWANPDFPAVSPVDFIPLLEDSGDINAVGKWVISTALAQMQEWLKERPTMKISINVSYLQFKDPTFKNFVLQETERFHFPKNQLLLELTESCNVVDPGALAQELNFFRQHGIQIALDDFGTGYASLSILRDLSADWVKVDHTFVAQIANSDYDRALTEHLIRLCQKLGLEVCVEGIETQEIQDVIQQYAPASLQGYYYSRPVTADVFAEKFIRAKDDLGCKEVACIKA